MPPTPSPPPSSELLEIMRAQLDGVVPVIAAWVERGVVGTAKRNLHDFVTECDQAVEARLRAGLLDAVGGSAFVGEEAGPSGSENPVVRWHVDPIDGTGNLLAGIPFFSVSIAAEVKGDVVAAVIGDPSRGEVFAYCDDVVWLDDVAVTRAHVTDPIEAVLVTNAPLEGDKAIPSRVEAFGRALSHFRTVRRLGSVALDLAYIAVGRADATAGSDVGWWDVAAGAAMVRAVGGRVDIDGPSADWKVRSFVATAPGLDPNDPVLRALAD